MGRKREPMPEIIELILREKGYRDSWRPLKDMAEEVESLRANLNGKVLWVKWTGLILLVLVPIGSAIVTSLTSLKNPSSYYGFTAAEIASFILTVLTILNSIFRPRDRFRKCCNLELDLDNIEHNVLLELENLPSIDLAKMVKMEQRFLQELEKLPSTETEKIIKLRREVMQEELKLPSFGQEILLQKAEALNISLQPIRKSLIDLFLPDSATNSDSDAAPKDKPLAYPKPQVPAVDADAPQPPDSHQPQAAPPNAPTNDSELAHGSEENPEKG